MSRLMRYHIGLYDRAGEVASHHAATLAEARTAAARLRQYYPRCTVVIHDGERDGREVDDEGAP
jgi:glycine/D-amino acid oxidase-like deaminating enzyme